MCLLCYAFVAAVITAGAAPQNSGCPLLENPFIADHNRACGAMCITFIDHYLDGNRGYEEVCRICTPGALGLSVREVAEGLETLGYFVQPLKVDVEDLKRITIPVIVYCKLDNNQGHFIVSLGWNAEREYFEVFDPPGQFGGETPTELEKRFGGLVLAVSKSSLPDMDKMIQGKLSWTFWIGVLLCLVGLRLFFNGPFCRHKLAARPAGAVVLLFCAVGVCGTSCDRLSSNGRAPKASEGVVQTAATTKGTYDVNLGTISAGEELRATFTVVNETSNPFRMLTVDRSCTCHIVDTDLETPIPPHGNAQIAIFVPTGGLEGPVEKAFTIVTDSTDAKYTRIPLMLRATVKVPLKCVPSQVMFGTVGPDTDRTRTLCLFTDPPELADAFTLATSTNDRVTIHLRNRQSAGLVFDVVLAADCPIGEIRSEIHFKFNDQKQSDLKLAVLGRRVGPVTVIPSRVYENDLALASETKLLIASSSGKPFTLRLASAPPGVTVMWDKQGESKRRYVVSVNIEHARSSTDGIIRFATDIIGANIVTVPVVRAD
jgi:hypothetical protein